MRRGSGGAGGLAMRLDDYRVMKRPDKKLESAWGLWSEKSQSWLDLLFPSEQSAREALDYLHRHSTGKDHQCKASISKRSERKSVESGKSVSGREYLGGRRRMK